VIFATPPLEPDEQAALAAIDEVRRELRHFVAEPRRWLGSVRRVMTAKAIQGSNSIEGYNVTDEDAVAVVEGEEPMDAEEEDWAVIRGYRSAMTYVLQLAHDEHFEYTPALIRSLHFMMTEYSLDASPGLWRPGPIWISNEETGDIMYEGPEASDVPNLIEELVADLRTTPDDVPPLVKAAMGHLNLIMIHPFRDGNGRMSRCLQTLILARDKILAPEWSNIEEFLGHSRNTRDYYRVLAEVGTTKWDPTQDARPWIKFCLRAHYIQATSVLRRVRESETIWQELITFIDDSRLQKRTIMALFDAALGLKVRNGSYRAALRHVEEDISVQVATSDLKSMVAAGLLVQNGKKRGTFYVAAPKVAAIRAALVEARRPIDLDSPIQLDSVFRRAA
jgi:Fic family protein